MFAEHTHSHGTADGVHISSVGPAAKAYYIFASLGQTGEMCQRPLFANQTYAGTLLQLQLAAMNTNQRACDVELDAHWQAAMCNGLVESFLQVIQKSDFICILQ